MASLIHGLLFMIAKSLFDSIDVGHYLLHSLWIKNTLYHRADSSVFIILDFSKNDSENLRMAQFIPLKPVRIQALPEGFRFCIFMV